MCGIFRIPYYSGFGLDRFHCYSDPQLSHDEMCTIQSKQNRIGGVMNIYIYNITISFENSVLLHNIPYINVYF